MEHLLNSFTGKALKELSRKKRVPVKAIAEHLGVSTQSIYELFRKDSMLKTTYEKVKSAIVSESESVTVDENPSPEQVVINQQTEKAYEIAEMIKENQFLKRQVEELTSIIKMMVGGKFRVSDLLATA